MPKRRGHGEGSIYQRHTEDCPPAVDGERPKHACKGRWVATVDLGTVDGQRRRKTLYGDTRKEVAIKLQTALAAKSSGTLVTGRMTVEKWLHYWLNDICPVRGLKPNTMRSHRSKVERYIIPHIGHLTLERLAPEHLRAMYARLADQGLSENTLVQTHAILRRALKVAVRERKAPYNVADLIDPPQPEKNPRRGLSVEQAQKVLRLAGDDPRWYVALYLGMRQGEALALRWCDIDLHGGVLHVERSVSVMPGGGYVYGTPKTRLSQAPLPLPTPVLSRLQVKWAQHVAAGGGPEDLVFTRADGSPVPPRADWAAWRDLLAEAEVPHVPLHAARNTTATLLRHFGVVEQDVRDIMRHSTVAMTNHYQGDDLDRKREALAALESGLADPGQG